MVRVLLFGDRYWSDPVPIEVVVQALLTRWNYRQLLVIEGKAPGADTLAGSIAKAHDIHVAEVGALWGGRRKRGAGPARNGVMAALDPHLGVGFHTDIAHSTGTADMAEKLRRGGTPCVIIDGIDKAHRFARRITR